MKYKLRLSIDDYETLYDHLLGNFGKEAVAIGLCGRKNHDLAENCYNSL
mgnify:CR=1 FL=1